MNNFWIFKFFLVSVFFLFNVYMGFFNNDLSTLQASMHALFAGVALLSLGMCVYHDASHFALYAVKIIIHISNPPLSQYWEKLIKNGSLILIISFYISYIIFKYIKMSIQINIMGIQFFLNN